MLSKLKDYSLGSLIDKQIYDILKELIRPAIVKFWACKVDLSKRNDDLSCFFITLNDMEIEILANFMVMQYIDNNFLKTQYLLKSSLNSKDFMAIHGQEQISRLIEIHDLARKENEQLISMYSINGSQAIWGDENGEYVSVMRDRSGLLGFGHI